MPIAEEKLQNLDIPHLYVLSFECNNEEGVEESETSGGADIIIVGQHP